MDRLIPFLSCLNQENRPHLWECPRYDYGVTPEVMRGHIERCIDRLLMEKEDPPNKEKKRLVVKFTYFSKELTELAEENCRLKKKVERAVERVWPGELAALKECLANGSEHYVKGLHRLIHKGCFYLVDRMRDVIGEQHFLQAVAHLPYNNTEWHRLMAVALTSGESKLYQIFFNHLPARRIKDPVRLGKDMAYLGEVEAFNALLKKVGRRALDSQTLSLAAASGNLEMVKKVWEAYPNADAQRSALLFKDLSPILFAGLGGNPLTVDYISGLYSTSELKRHFPKNPAEKAAILVLAVDSLNPEVLPAIWRMFKTEQDKFDVLSANTDSGPVLCYAIEEARWIPEDAARYGVPGPETVKEMAEGAMVRALWKLHDDLTLPHFLQIAEPLHNTVLKHYPSEESASPEKCLIVKSLMALRGANLTEFSSLWDPVLDNIASHLELVGAVLHHSAKISKALLAFGGDRLRESAQLALNEGMPLSQRLRLLPLFNPDTILKTVNLVTAHEFDQAKVRNRQLEGMSGPAYAILETMRREWADRIYWDRQDNDGFATYLFGLLQDAVKKFSFLTLAALTRDSRDCPNIIACLGALTDLQLAVVIPLMREADFDACLKKWPALPRHLEILRKATHNQKRRYLQTTEILQPLKESVEGLQDKVAEGVDFTAVTGAEIWAKHNLLMVRHQLHRLEPLFEEAQLEPIKAGLADLESQYKKAAALVRRMDAEQVETRPCCPITREPMQHPVALPSGQICEREAIEAWIRTKGTNPFTRDGLTLKELRPVKKARC